jgi:hypothetical protein
MLGISASASFSGYGGGASASMSFAKSVEITQDSFFVAVNLLVTKLRQVVQYPSFTTDAAKILATTPPDYIKFLRAFGDQYCSEVVFGGQLILLFRWDADSLNEQQSLDVQASGSYGTFNAAASLTDKIKKLQTTETTDIQVWMTGQTAPLYSKPEDVSKFIENFPTTIVDRGYVIQRSFLDYTTVVGNLPPHAKIHELSQNKENIAKLEVAATTLDDATDKLGYVQSFPQQYKVDQSYLKSLQIAVKPLGTVAQETAIPDTLKILKAQRAQVEQTANKIIADPLGYNEPLKNLVIPEPEIPLPPTLDGRVVPITLQVNMGGNNTVDGKGGDWIGQPNSQINWLIIKFVERLFNRPNPPLGLEYNAITKTGGTGWDHIETGWLPSTTAYQAGQIYAIAFRLVGRDAKLYDVQYTGRLKNGTETPPAQNGNYIGGKAPQDDGQGYPPGYALSQLQLQIISKF